MFMALINCPRCNHTVSNKSKKCIMCGYKIRKVQINKKTIFALLCVLLMFVILLFTITFITSQVSLKQYLSLISEKNISCILGNHHWKDATCYKPKYCLMCDSQKGEPIEHLWNEANCTNSKMCSNCKTTEGKPLGHTVNIGCCTRCNKYVNKYDIEFTVIKESISCLRNCYRNIHNYFNISSSAVSELYYCNLVQNEVLNLKKASCIAIDMCGDIEEFSEIKKCFIRIDSALNGEIDTKLTLDNYISYANTLSSKINNSIDAYNELIKEMNEINVG